MATTEKDFRVKKGIIVTENATVGGDLTVTGNLNANGPLTGDLSGNADTASAWETARTITLTGPITGSVSIDGSGDVSITTSVSVDSVNLGTDTTGNYVDDVTAGNYIIKTGTAGEGWSPTIAVDATSDNTASKVVARDSSGNFSAGTITAALSGNASTATTLQTARTISLTGDVTGSVSFNGSSNVSISAVVANDSHTHDSRYYTESEANSRFIVKNTGYTWTSVGVNALSFRSGDVLEGGGDQAALEVYQDTAGADAFMQFHVAGDFAAYFGLKGDINDFAVGGWSMGNVYHRVWHAGNDGSGSGLDADTVDGLQASSFVRGDNVDNGSVIIRVNDTDFVVSDSTDPTTNFIWRDHSENKLLLGTANAVVTTRSDLEVNGNLVLNGTVTTNIDLSGNDIIGIDRLNFVNQEGSSFGVAGDVIFDENFYSDAYYGTAWSGGDGGGLAVYNQDGWGRILTDRNVQWFNPTFDGMYSTGNVGIGTTSPSEKLHVVGNSYFQGEVSVQQKLFIEDGKHSINNNDGSGNFNIKVGMSADSARTQTESGYGSHWTFSQGNGTWTFITSTDNPGVGNAYNLLSVLTLTRTGDLSAAGNVTAYSSDRRLKTNIKNIDSPLKKLKKINGVMFNWSDDINEKGFYGANPGDKEIGVIAQEVQAIIPEVIAPAPFDRDENGESKSGEDYLTVRYEKLVPLLIEAIKEQNEKVERLEQLVEKLLADK